MTERKNNTTAKTAKNIFGDKPYQILARKALPLLVRQAKAEQSITYKSLAEELDMPNPRNLNWVLGSIGETLIELSEEWQDEIPAIQSLVVNKSTGMPGEGIAGFFMDEKKFKKLSSKSKRDLLKQELQKVCQYNRWDDVLKKLGLEPARTKQFKTSKSNAFSKYKGGGKGESKEHKKLKKFVSRNPQIIGLPVKVGFGKQEYEFPSGDAVDVLFVNKNQWIGVEVKTIKSNIERWKERTRRLAAFW